MGILLLYIILIMTHHFKLRLKTKMPVYRTIFILTCMVLLFSGCGSGEKGNLVVAVVGDTKITKTDLNERIARLPERYQNIVNMRKDEFLQDVVNDTLVYQEALRKGVHKDPDLLKILDQAKKKIIIAKFLKDNVAGTVVVTDEEVEDYYNANKDKYNTAEIMRVSHILLPTKEEAEAILAQLNDGAEFDALARAKSVDPTAQKGGDIGYFPKGQLIPEFEKTCAALEVGQTSGVVKTKLGYHIIKLTDRRPPQPRPLEQVRSNIQISLKTEKKQQKFNELLERLREETDIKINTDALEEHNNGGENDGK